MSGGYLSGGYLSGGICPRISLPPLRVTLTHFTFLSDERALRPPTSFPISGLARLGVKPRLCRLSWRAFASTHSLMLSSASSREALLACPPSPPWHLPSFTVESTLSFPCFCSDPPLHRQGVALAHLDSLPLMIWCSGQTALFLFILAKAAPAYLPTALSVALRLTLSFLAGPVCSSFSAKVCAILHALCWSRQHQQACHFSFLLLQPDSRSVLASRSSPPSFLSNSVADLAGTVFSLLLFYQTTMGPWTLVPPKEQHGR